MDKRLEEAIEYCLKTGLNNVVFAVPYQLSPEDEMKLRQISICKAMVLYCPSPELTATSSWHWLGCFVSGGDWHLPPADGVVVFVGSQLMLTRKMAMRVLKTKRLTIFCKINDVYQPLRLYRFFLWRIGQKLHKNISQLGHNNLLRKSLYRLAAIPFIKSVWDKVFSRKTDSQLNQVKKAGPTGEALYRQLLQRGLSQPQQLKIKPIPGRVLLVNAGLAAGGAERQIVNTLIGLRDSVCCESVALLAEYIDHAPHLDFFLHELQSKKIEVAQIKRIKTLAEDGLSSLPLPVAEVAANLPENILEEILNLVEEFRYRRPSVVHAWQDSTSIKAGIAAVIAGVPCIVLGSRNVAPFNFNYLQDYMHPAYRALASLDCITFLNNSDAGAIDYTQWLGLSRKRFEVVRNGVNLGYLQRAETSVIKKYRESLGIPMNAKVIGSVFRFWAEKRPMLWLQTAAYIAKRFPEIHFLIIGEGPMRSEMEAFISDQGLKGRVHLPGARSDVALPLSAIDIFLLCSEFEGTPNVVLEAQWLGLPVVATNAGGTREAIAEGITGWCCSTPDVMEIANNIIKILSDISFADRVSHLGPKFVEQNFNLNKMIEHTLCLYGYDQKISLRQVNQ